MGNRYFITGVSNVDPFTQVQYVKDKPINSRELYLDGSMLNILRKYLKDNKEFTDIYIYLTEEMDAYKDKYEKAIQILYGEKSVNIKFYPDDFFPEERYKTRLRQSDVHRFASYYKEIYDIYREIKSKTSNNQEPEIVLNISSGTSAFKADMMLMAVTNNLIIEQTADIISSSIINELRKYALENDTEYKDILEDCKIKSNSKNLNFSEISDKDFYIMMDKLDKTENNIENRSRTEDISETKKVILLESIEDSIEKADYAGIYYSIKDNKQYLSKNQNELVNVAKNLYFRYIGNNGEDFDNIIKEIDNNSKGMNPKRKREILQRDELDKIKEMYPIFKMKFNENVIKNSKDENEIKNVKKAKDINYVIEKFNIMKVKSKREEINDWLLIVIPLLEYISRKITQKYSEIDFGSIKEKGKICLSSFDEKYPQKEYLKEAIKKEQGENVNEFLYMKILEKVAEKEGEEGNEQKKNKILKIKNRMEIINLAREDRKDAAHSIKSVNKREFDNRYKKKIQDYKESNEKTDYINDIINEQKYDGVGENGKYIRVIETQFKELIRELLPENANEDIFEESLNIYKTLEEKIDELLKDEIYKSEDDNNG